MPALSPLSSGVGINETMKKDLLSPILRETEIDGFTPIVVEEKVGVFRFPQIGLMRSMVATYPPR
jgi:metallophosphoesterase superfamily enzyme